MYATVFFPTCFVLFYFSFILCVLCFCFCFCCSYCCSLWSIQNDIEWIKECDVHHVLFTRNCIEYVCTRHLNKCGKRKIRQVNIKMKYSFSWFGLRTMKRNVYNSTAISHTHTHTHTRGLALHTRKTNNSFYFVSVFFSVSFYAHTATKTKSKRSWPLQYSSWYLWLLYFSSHSFLWMHFLLLSFVSSLSLSLLAIQWIFLLLLLLRAIHSQFLISPYIFASLKELK